MALSSVYGGVGPAAASGLRSLWLAVLYLRSQLPQASSYRVWWHSSLQSVVVAVAVPDCAPLPPPESQGLEHWWVLCRAKVENMSVIPEGQCQDNEITVRWAPVFQIGLPSF